MVLCKCLRLLKDKNICLCSSAPLASTSQQEDENETMLVNGRSRNLPLILLSPSPFLFSLLCLQRLKHTSGEANSRLGLSLCIWNKDTGIFYSSRGFGRDSHTD